MTSRCFPGSLPSGKSCEQYCHVLDTGPPSRRLVALLKDTLAATRERSSSYENIYILLPEGEVLASNDPGPEEIPSLQDLEVIKRLRNTEEPVFGPVFRHADQRWRLHLAAQNPGPGRPAAGH